MKVLQICHKPPFPPVDGGCIAMNNISQGLIKLGIDLKILTINTFKHPLNPGALPEDYLEKTKIETTFVDTRIRLLDALKNFLSDKSYNIERFYSKDFEIKIQQTLSVNTFDIVHLESLFSTPYLDCIRKNSTARIIYRAHNIEYKIWEELASGETGFFKKQYLNLLVKRMYSYESQLMNLFDGIAAISMSDVSHLKALGCSIPVENIAFGINMEDYPHCTETVNHNNVFFLGAMDWIPNKEGVDWFLKNSWNKILESKPDMQLKIAGKSMPLNFMRAKIQNTEIIGEVKEAKKFMLDNGVMIVPLLSGSGVRVKIIEAMALGKVVVATSVAAGGINCEHKKNILIADSPGDFAEAVLLAMRNEELRKSISENARKFAENNFDNAVITANLISFYKSVLTS